MALRLKPDENFELSCAARVDLGKRDGVQVYDMRISLAGLDQDPAERDEGEAWTALDYTSGRFNEFLNSLNLKDIPESVVSDFEAVILKELNDRFSHNGRVIYRRFIIFGLELSVESLMKLEAGTLGKPLH